VLSTHWSPCTLQKRLVLYPPLNTHWMSAGVAAKQEIYLDSGSAIRGHRCLSAVADPHARAWLTLQSHRGLTHNTLDAYSRGVERYFRFLAQLHFSCVSVVCSVLDSRLTGDELTTRVSYLRLPKVRRDVGYDRLLPLTLRCSTRSTEVATTTCLVLHVQSR
jgi:hypothetical protein